VWFEVMRAAESPRGVGDTGGGQRRLFFWLISLFYLLVLVAAALLARRNLRLGRGDRRGALRVGMAIAAGNLLHSLCSGHHVAGLEELNLLSQMLAASLAFGGFGALAYLALEPMLRRRWPRLMISWNRWLAGDWRDPLVGRDALLGSALALVSVTVSQLSIWLVPLPAGRLLGEELGSALPRSALEPVGAIGTSVLAALTVPISCLLFVLLMATVLRSRLAAQGLFALLFAGVLFAGDLPGSTPVATAVAALLLAALWTFVFTRLGLFAAVAFHFVMLLAGNAPLVLAASSWLPPFAVVLLAAILAPALWGAWTAVGGRAGLARWLPAEA